MKLWWNFWDWKSISIYWGWLMNYWNFFLFSLCSTVIHKDGYQLSIFNLARSTSHFCFGAILCCWNVFNLSYGKNSLRPSSTLFTIPSLHTYNLPTYPLVTVYISIEHHHFEWVNRVNQLFLWPFSITFSKFTRPGSLQGHVKASPKAKSSPSLRGATDMAPWKI